MQQQQPPNSRSIAGATNQSPLIPPPSNSLYHQQYAGYPHPGLHQSPYGSLDPNQSSHLNSAYGQSSLNKPNAALAGYPPMPSASSGGSGAPGYPPGLGLLQPGSSNAAAANSMPRRPTPTNQLPSHYQTAAALNSINSGRTAPSTMPNYNQNHGLGQIAPPGNPYGASPYHHASPYGGQMPSPNELWPGQLHQNRLPYPGGYSSNSNSTQNSSPYLHSAAAAAAAASTYSATQQALHNQAAARSAYYGSQPPTNNGASSLTPDNSLISNNSSAFNQSPYGRYGQPPSQQQQQTGSSTGLPPGYHTGYDSQTRLSQQSPYSSSSSSAYGYGKYSSKKKNRKIHF